MTTRELPGMDLASLLHLIATGEGELAALDLERARVAGLIAAKRRTLAGFRALAAANMEDGTDYHWPGGADVFYLAADGRPTRSPLVDPTGVPLAMPAVPAGPPTDDEQAFHDATAAPSSAELASLRVGLGPGPEFPHPDDDDDDELTDAAAREAGEVLGATPAQVEQILDDFRGRDRRFVAAHAAARDRLHLHGTDLGPDDPADEADAKQLDAACNGHARHPHAG